MFSALTFGTALFVTGLIGLDMRRSHGLFQGIRWADGPIWTQTAIGLGLLLLGVHWARRLPRWTSTTIPPGQTVKSVGRGKSAGAELAKDRRSLQDAQPKA